MVLLLSISIGNFIAKNVESGLSLALGLFSLAFQLQRRPHERYTIHLQKIIGKAHTHTFLRESKQNIVFESRKIGSEHVGPVSPSPPWGPMGSFANFFASKSTCYACTVDRSL